MELIEIFQPGKFTTMDGEVITFSEGDCRKIAGAYDPGLYESPIVVGHPKADEPAFGWVKSLAFLNGRVKAEPGQVEPQFAEMVNSGRFKKVSASLFRPDSPNNPVKGGWYLRHVGFLGAQAPALKGLKPASFKENEQGVVLVTIDFCEREKKMEPTNTPAPGATPPASQPGTGSANFAEREKTLKEREERISRQEAEMKKRDFANFLEDLSREGKFLPALKSGMVEFMAGLPQGEVCFAEGDQAVKKTPIDFIKDYLKKQPKVVEFGEFIKGDVKETEKTVEFAAPAGFSVDKDKLELHQKAIAYMGDHAGVDYVAAVKAVGGK